MKDKFWPFKWKCPKCKEENCWMWPYEDIPIVGDVILMKCGKCGKDTNMICTMKKVKK